MSGMPPPPPPDWEQEQRPLGGTPTSFNPRIITALVVIIMAIVIIGITLKMPWWNLTVNDEGIVTNFDYSLGQVCHLSPTESGCLSYQYIASNLPSFKLVSDTFELTNIFMLAGFIMAILTLIFLISGIFHPKIGLVAMICGIIGSILVLVAPLYLFAFLPGAMNFWSQPANCPINFFGSTTCDSTHFCSSGSFGWFFAIFTFVLFLIATVLSFKVTRNSINQEK